MRSTDGTASLAAELGCKIMPFEPEPAQDPNVRSAGIRAARGEWIISLDPDMRIPPETRERMRAIVDNNEADIIDFRLINVWFGRPCRYGHGSDPFFRHMFRKELFEPQGADVHSFLHDSVKEGRVMILSDRFPLIHYSYQSVEQAFEVLTRYARREADLAIASGDDGSFGRICYRPARSLVRSIIVKQGFRDGKPGWLIALLVSYYIFLREALIWDAARRSPVS
jgi:glycosyltransferase involved in cell wall biosynthesis